MRCNKFLNELGDLFTRIEHLNMPTISAIDGPALGGGLELAQTCGIRIVGHPVIPKRRTVIIPWAGGTQRMPRIIEASRAKELISRDAFWMALNYGEMSSE